MIISETDKEKELYIEIQKSISNFEKGDCFIIEADLLYETSELIWKNLI